MTNKKATTLLSEKAVMVRFITRHWSGIKVDKGLRKKLAEFTKGNERSYHASKFLVGRDCNKYFRSILDQFRRHHYYPLTVPWDDNSTGSNGSVRNGYRLCPTSKLTELQDAYNKAFLEFDVEVKGFIKNYPRLIVDAEQHLGTAFNIADYPPVEELKHKFRFELQLKQVEEIDGDKDIRLNVSKELKERLVRESQERIRQNVKTIGEETVATLVDAVSHLADKLKNYDPSDKQGSFFKNSSIDNIKQILSVLPSINDDILGSDPKIHATHQKLVSALAKVGKVESLREGTDKGEDKRKSVAKELDDSIDELKGDFLSQAFGGGNND
jgi:hypothetical protein